MNGPIRPGIRSLLLAGAVLTALLPSFLAAQDGADFLFRRPMVSLSVRGGYAVPRAQSDLFDFTREQLWTADQRNLSFSSPVLQFDLAVRATERVDVVASVGVSQSETSSEFRDWVGTDDLPIQQTTTFGRVPLTLGVKGYLLPRGRSVSRFAWVPARWSPYVGAGAGAVRYVFDQSGEFVDFQTLDIFRDHFRSEGWAPTAHLLAGVDLSLARYFVLTGEGRYGWASTRLGTDFVDFEEIDLAGFQATVGLSLRF